MPAVTELNALRETFVRLDAFANNTIAAEDLKSLVEGGEGGEATGAMYYLPTHIRTCPFTEASKSALLNHLSKSTARVALPLLLELIGESDVPVVTERPPSRISLSWLQELYWRVDKSGSGNGVTRAELLEILRGEARPGGLKMPPQHIISHPAKTDGLPNLITCIAEQTSECIRWREIVEHVVRAPMAANSPPDSSDEDDCEVSAITSGRADSLVRGGTHWSRPRAGSHASGDAASEDLNRFFTGVRMAPPWRQSLVRRGCQYTEDVKQLSMSQLRVMGIPEGIHRRAAGYRHHGTAAPRPNSTHCGRYFREKHQWAINKPVCHADATNLRPNRIPRPMSAGRQLGTSPLSWKNKTPSARPASAKLSSDRSTVSSSAFQVEATESVNELAVHAAAKPDAAVEAVKSQTKSALLDELEPGALAAVAKMETNEQAAASEELPAAVEDDAADPKAPPRRKRRSSVADIVLP